MRPGAVLLALVLAGCQPAGPYIVLRPPGTSPTPPRARAEATAPARPAEAAWSFSVTVKGCEARAAAAGLLLVLRVEGDRRLRIALSGARGSAARPTLAFTGPEGELSLPARRSGALLLADVPAGEAPADRARTLLGGGTLRLGGGPALLSLPDAGVAGRDWLGCVRPGAEG